MSFLAAALGLKSGVGFIERLRLTKRVAFEVIWQQGPRAVRPRYGIQVNAHLSWRIWSRKSGLQLAVLRRVLTLPLVLLARTRPRAKRRTMAMFLAPWPVR